MGTMAGAFTEVARQGFLAMRPSSMAAVNTAETLAKMARR